MELLAETQPACKYEIKHYATFSPYKSAIVFHRITNRSTYRDDGTLEDRIIISGQHDALSVPFKNMYEEDYRSLFHKNIITPIGLLVPAPGVAMDCYKLVERREPGDPANSAMWSAAIDPDTYVVEESRRSDQDQPEGKKNNGGAVNCHEQVSEILSRKDIAGIDQAKIIRIGKINQYCLEKGLTEKDLQFLQSLPDKGGAK